MATQDETIESTEPKAYTRKRARRAAEEAGRTVVGRENTGVFDELQYSYNEPTYSVDGKLYDTGTGKRIDSIDQASSFRTSKPRSAYDIEQDLLKSAQGEISSLRSLESNLLREQAEINQKNERSTSSISVLTGLAGSTDANQAAQKTAKAGQEANDRIRNEVETRVQGILSGIRTTALAEARAEREDARLDEAARIEARKARQEEAVTNLQNLSASGVTFEGLRQGDPESFSYLVSQFGGEEALRGAWVLNTPQDQVLDKRIEGGKYVIAKQNPVTGAVTVETVDLGLPPQYTKTVDAGNRIIAIPDDWSGDPSELVTLNKGLSPAQQQEGTDTGGAVGATGNVARDAQSIMDGILNLTDVSVAKNYRSAVAAELRRRAEEAKLSGDIYGVMKASAAYDKEVSDTFLQSMEKTISVLEQLGVLQENINGTNTGPLVGAFRGANPWDTNAQTIKAQLNAIVPNLARGVYGEVGVLTDNDIKTYSKTIPNLTATEDVRNAILYITMDMIRKNVETKIRNQAAGQRDMSGYADIYKQVQDTATSILMTIPGASVVSTATNLRDRVEAAGYSYEAMKADGLSDEEIEQAL